MSANVDRRRIAVVGVSPDQMREGVNQSRFDPGPNGFVRRWQSSRVSRWNIMVV